MGSNMANAPSAAWYIVDVFRHNDIYTVQVAYSFTTSTCPVYIRTQTNGTWNAWRLFNPGTANTAQVLTGYTFSSANGVNLSGTMANRGRLNWSGINTTYGVPAGYYSGGTLDSRGSYNSGYNNGVNAGKTSFTLTVVSGWPDSQYQTFGATVGAYYIAAMGGDPGYFNEFAVSGATITSNVTTGSTPPDGANFARMVTMRATSGQITVNWGDTLGYGGGGIVCRVN